ncbi:MAG: sugar phosphate nucleotidyltransferase [Actinomycetota bacterium]|jgi:mannose-1-phosphate guanylyltransferase/phosphomannomutase|nr:sugar phosphate nucleotidyltransferase [Actinomycetota bacterium]
MKAVIMAGGEGTRLRPLTSSRPKPMVPIVNQPVMEHIVGLVKHHGITDIVATLAFMPHVIEDYFGSGEEWGVRIEYAHEDTPLGTAGSVKNAEYFLDDTEPFIVISGDAMTDIDLTDVIAFHRDKGAAVTIALKSVSEPLEFGVVITNEDGRIERFVEKPTWGQVFSDTINTGIYVIDPKVLEFIPEGEPFDFSSDLFPLLMEKGYSLYGRVVDGYWCDVGSLGTYRQCHNDILDGQAMVYIPGVKARDGLWVGEGTSIDQTAELGIGVVLGANVEVREGVRLGGHCVVGDNCVIGNEANVSHSIIWSDSFIGKNSTIDGAVLCRQVDIRARARVDIGAVIGDETMIGRGAHIGADVQIYPFKRVEPSAVVSSSLIWESTGNRSLFGDNGIAGLVGIDITPERAMRAAQAFGTLLSKGSHVVVSRDSSRSSRMIKRAMVAGLNATGCNVRDLRVASQAVNRLTTRDTRCAGGVHVCASQSERQSLEIHFYDKTGLDIAPWDEKKVERLYFREEFRRAFFKEIGDIIYPPRALEYYATGLGEAMYGMPFKDGWRKVVADFDYGVASIVMPNVLEGRRVNLLSLNPFIDAETSWTDRSRSAGGYDETIHAMGLFAADFGVRFERSGERITLITPKGRVLDGDTALHAVLELWCTMEPTGKSVAVPLGASATCELIAERTGRKVIRPGRSQRSLAILAREGDVGFAGSGTGGYIFPSFLSSYDGVMAMTMIARMIDTLDVDLDSVVDSLPRFFKCVEDVFCPIERKGAVMRAITEATQDMNPNLTEGVRVLDGDGWVLVLPHMSEPLVTVTAEGADESSMREISERWMTIVKNAMTLQ